MWYEAEQFPFMAPLAAEWETIKRELANVHYSMFQPWSQVHMYDQPGGWQVMPLFADIYPALQDVLPRNRKLFPRTTELVSAIPGMTSCGFSALYPHTEITEHTGEERGCLRSHLGIIIPENAAMEAAGEVRAWQDGEWLVFDDTYLHASWNRSDTIRIILMVDFLREAYGIPTPVHESASS